MNDKYAFLTVFLLLFFAAAPLAAEPELGRQEVRYQFESEPSQPLAQYVPSSRDPRLSLRASGALYLLAVTGGHKGASAALAVSHNRGDSFAPPRPISGKDAAVSSHGENSPNFSFGPGIEAYALWEERTGDGLQTRLLFARSPAFGREWEEPVEVTDKTEPSTNAFSSFTVAPDGHIYVVWLDGRDAAKTKPGTSSVYLAKSADGGRTFGKNVAVARSVCPCCRPTVLADAKGVVHVSWRHVFEGNIRDMAVATSTNGGKEFAGPVRVAHDNWEIEGCPHSGASMVQHNGRIWISWYSDGDGTNPGVRLAWSDDGAKTFSDPVLASGDVLDANHPSLAVADDGRILLAFQGRDPVKQDGWAPSGPYLVEVTPEGRASRPIAVPGHEKSISYPVVAGGSLGRVFVAWTEPGKDGRQVRLSRGRKIAGDGAARAEARPGQ